MEWLLIALAAVAVMVIALVVVGRETGLLTRTARPAVYEVESAVTFIADQVPEETSARISYDDVRWVLRADVDGLEAATVTGDPARIRILDEDDAVARVLVLADEEGRDLDDADVAAVLAARMKYLVTIGAIGGEALMPEDPSEP